MNELLNELLTLIDQNVIRIQPYTLDDSQRPAIQARVDDWTRRTRQDATAIENAEYARLKAATDWLAKRCEPDQCNISPVDRQAILILLRSFGRGQTPLETPDPQHCYLCDRPKLDCACVVEDFV